jgi:hypothetical protein
VPALDSFYVNKTGRCRLRAKCGHKHLEPKLSLSALSQFGFTASAASDHSTPIRRTCHGFESEPASRI